MAKLVRGRRMEGIFESHHSLVCRCRRTHLYAVANVVSEVDDPVGNESDFDEVLADAVIAEKEAGSRRRPELKPNVARLTTVERRQGQTGAYGG